MPVAAYPRVEIVLIGRKKLLPTVQQTGHCRPRRAARWLCSGEERGGKSAMRAGKVMKDCVMAFPGEILVRNNVGVKIESAPARMKSMATQPATSDSRNGNDILDEQQEFNDSKIGGASKIKT